MGDIASQKKDDKKKIVVGKSTYSKIQSVPTYRNVDLFIFSVHPSIAVSVIKECVQDALTSCSAGDDDRCNKNLAIANRSRVSCINTNNNTMTLKSGLEVTQGH